MSQLVWNQPESQIFETGVDRGVLYVDGQSGVAWNGLIAVTETPSGGQAQPYFQDGVKTLNVASTEEFEGEIEAFYSPSEFDICDGSVPLITGVLAGQQARASFGLCFRTKAGDASDVSASDYKLHLVYNATAQPTDREYVSSGEDIEPLTFTWAITTKPVPFPGFLPTAHLVINSAQSDNWRLALLEEYLYGGNTTAPRLPAPSEILELFSIDLDLIVVDNGDGTFSVTSYSPTVQYVDSDTFQITSSAVIEVTEDSYKIVYL